ncbi:hypothetical protein ABEF79_00955 [Acinetobacter sp. ANC 7454]|uniref:hypothetical protein n=1 Tax=Acinetobacter thermotolerans TaxID=3151487 RepID=UPI00325AF8EF
MNKPNDEETPEIQVPAGFDDEMYYQIQDEPEYKSFLVVLLEGLCGWLVYLFTNKLPKSSYNDDFLDQMWPLDRPYGSVSHSSDSDKSIFEDDDHRIPIYMFDEHGNVDYTHSIDID